MIVHSSKIKKRKILISFGLIASLAALLAIASDLGLLMAKRHYHVYWGFYLAVVAMPAFGFGYYMLASLLRKHSYRAASIVFGLGLYISALSTTIHSLTGLYAYVLMLEKGTFTVTTAMIGPVAQFIVPLYIIGIICCLILSVIFGRFVLNHQTVLPKWFIVLNPIPILTILYLISLTGKSAAQVIEYTIFHTTHFIIFATATAWLIAFTSEEK